MPVVGKVHQTKALFRELEDDLNSIEETTHNELTELMERFTDLQEVFDTAKKTTFIPRPASTDDLENIGVLRESLHFNPECIAELMGNTASPVTVESARLYERIQEIYEYVQIGPSSPRMILDSALLSLAKVISNTQYPDSVKRSVALVPQRGLSDMLKLGDGITVVNPITHQKVSITGRMDYTIFRYTDRHNHKKGFLQPMMSYYTSLIAAPVCLFLVEIKRVEPCAHFRHHDCTYVHDDDYIPEAICQAIASATFKQCDEARLCISNGHHWRFCLLKKDAKDGRWISYESNPCYISKSSSELEVREILQLLVEWLNPEITPGLYRLGE